MIQLIAIITGFILLVMIFLLRWVLGRFLKRPANRTAENMEGFLPFPLHNQDPDERSFRQAKQYNTLARAGLFVLVAGAVLLVVLSLMDYFIR
ncbi:MAG: hypothetical protein PHT77_11990 [Bacteroidales bacterium]|nr:hypothetical protein [Bacteroidales bacterium]MDD3962567.1 hypothetical protein [Bacteroidales bacterium]